MEPDPKRFREDPASRMSLSGVPSASAALKMKSVMALVDLGRPLDHTKFAVKKSSSKSAAAGANDSVGGRDKFQGVILKKQTPEGEIKGLVFASGRIVCSGAQSEVGAKTACMSMLNVVKQVMNPGKPLSALPTGDPPKAQYFVANYDTGYEIQLEHLALLATTEIVYEPEIFPALIYRSNQNSRAVAYVYSTGKVLLSCPHQEQIGEFWRTLEPVLRRYDRSKYGRTH